jgi:tRNA dimethylallyltransferase
MPSPRNVIAVCGPTATGKSKLAIELALALRARFHGGQVINADALQIYKALPLLTAKVTFDETKGVPHHLMSFLDPLEDDDYHMPVFRRDAFRVVRGASPHRFQTQHCARWSRSTTRDKYPS